MNRFLLAIVLSLCAPLPVFSRDNVTSVAVPAGTEVKMYVAGDGAPDQSARPGDVFAAKAAAAVVVKGLVVVQKDADGQGKIAEVRLPGRDAGSKSYALTFDWVFAVDGTKIALSSAGKAKNQTADPWWFGERLRSFGMAGVFRVVTAFTQENADVRASSSGSL